MPRMLLLSGLACIFFVAPGCDDTAPRQPEKRIETTKSGDVDDIRRITWLESTDKIKPELWLAALQSGLRQPDDEQVAAFRKLLYLASTEYLESPRMVANRMAQLVAMLRETGQQAESHEKALRDLLSLPRGGSTGNALAMSAVVAQYVNLRRGGMDREKALEALRDGRPAVNLEMLENKRGAPGEVSVRAAQSTSDQDVVQKKRADLEAVNILSVLQRKEVSRFVAAAAEVTSHDVPSDLPRIARISGEEISRVLCGGQRCSAVAFFDDRSRTVFVDERLDLEKNVVARSFVVHEVVHFFHLLDNRLAPDMECGARLVLEQEAYRAQNQYLASQGSQHRVSTRLLMSLCRGG